MAQIIVIGSGNHHNTLGVIRSLGEAGFNFELITFGNAKKNYVASSKYVTIHHAFSDVEEIIHFLKERKSSSKKEIILSCADIVTEQLNFLHGTRTFYSLSFRP